MLRSVNITRFFSGLLMVFFALSITPKRFLHDIFAKHIDNSKGPVKNNSHPYQLDNAGYNCDNDNLVAESSFEIEQQNFSFPVFFCFSAYTIQHISFSSTFGIYSPLRGPPAII